MLGAWRVALSCRPRCVATGVVSRPGGASARGSRPSPARCRWTSCFTRARSGVRRAQGASSTVSCPDRGRMSSGAVVRPRARRWRCPGASCGSSIRAVSRCRNRPRQRPPTDHRRVRVGVVLDERVVERPRERAARKSRHDASLWCRHGPPRDEGEEDRRHAVGDRRRDRSANPATGFEKSHRRTARAVSGYAVAKTRLRPDSLKRSEPSFGRGNVLSARPAR